MDTGKALHDFGVTPTTLSPAEKDSLDRDGFVSLPGILNGSQLETLRYQVDRLITVEGAEAGTEFQKEAGTDRLANLVDKGAEFEVCFTHPRVMAAIHHVLPKEIHLLSLHGRAALPGFGLQGLHDDAGRRPDHIGFRICNSIWLLDDFTKENGATRVVPGSHLFPSGPDSLEDPMKPHPDQILLTGEAGTVVVFNSHVWHGGTVNRHHLPRRALHAAFTRRELPQQESQKDYISAKTARRLSSAALYIVDIHTELATSRKGTVHVSRTGRELTTDH